MLIIEYLYEYNTLCSLFGIYFQLWFNPRAWPNSCIKTRYSYEPILCLFCWYSLNKLLLPLAIEIVLSLLK